VSGTADQDVEEPSLEDLLNSLNLKWEDIKDLFIAKAEVGTLKEEVKWMAVMRLLTTKPFSRMSLKKTMRFAWAPTKEVSFCDIKENRFFSPSKLFGRLEKNY
jgi:hypothetical protein